MTSSSFYEEGSRLLTPERLRVRARRRAEARRALAELPDAGRARNQPRVGRDDGDGRRRHGEEVAQLIGREVRDTDLLGHTDKGTLSLVLLDADFEHSTRVIDRLVARIENYEFQNAAAHRGRRRLLSDPRGRRRIAEAAGHVAAARQLAQRPVALHPIRTEGAAMKNTRIRRASRRRSRRSWSRLSCRRGLSAADSAVRAPTRRRSSASTGSAPATSCASRSTRTPSCRSRCRSGRTARSPCRSSATSMRPAARRSSCATRSRSRCANT